MNDTYDGDVVCQVEDGPWLSSWESLQNSHLMGCTVSQLGRIFLENKNEIDFFVFFPRIAVLFMLSLLNSCFALLDWAFYESSVSRTPLPPRPLFVIGQPRSGTTLLVNLLSLDEQFATPNTFEVGWPSSFLTMERFCNYWPLSSVLSPTRPMDNLPLRWDTPQEDEIAVNTMSGGASPYMAISFMRSWRRFMGLITFQGREEYARWESAFLLFARKLAFKYPNRRLLLKSPVHTGRVDIMQDLLGTDAQFVFVHRHPDEIFESSWRALVGMYFRPFAALQTFDSGNAQGYVLEHGKRLHDAYVAQARVLPPTRHVRVAFDDLRTDPVGAMKSVYEQLGMGDRFDHVRPAFEAHRDQVSDFQQNKFPPMERRAKELVRKEWKAMFTEFGYKA